MKISFEPISVLFTWHVLTPVVRKHICSSTMMMANTVLTLKQGNNYKGDTTESVIEKDKSLTK